MDGDRFDAWTRRLAGPRSRRAVVAAAAATALGIVGLAGPDREGGAAIACRSGGELCRGDADCCAGT